MFQIRFTIRFMKDYSEKNELYKKGGKNEILGLDLLLNLCKTIV